MKFCRIGFIVVILGSAFAGLDVSGSPKGLAESQRSLDDVLKYLRPALKSAGSGRIYYSTVCSANDNTALPFPHVDVGPPSKDKRDLAAVREIFKNKKEVIVTEDLSRMIRISIGKPSSAILQTRIHSLTLTPDQQYNPGLAVIAFETAREVKSAERELGFAHPLTLLDMNVSEPEKGKPHLPTSVKDITLDQALDLIAKTFGGIVMYGTCAHSKGERLYTLDYVGDVGVEDDVEAR